MNHLSNVLARQSRRVNRIIDAIDVGDADGAEALIERLHAVSPWELAAAGDAFAQDMLEAEADADGVVKPDADSTE